MIKRVWCVIVITCVLLMSFPIHGLAVTSDGSNLEKAVDMKILGLFNGTDKGFELERIPTRVEGAAMLMRLLGKEQEAKRLGLSHPFTDVPAWADSLVGYMYRNGLTTGTSSTTFGSSQQLTAMQYVTFVLRALAYDDKNNDFKYENALDKAVEAGLLTSSEASSLKSGSNILRNDIVGISYSALKTKLKNSAITLLDKLVSQDKVIPKTAATALKLYTSDLQAEYDNVTSYDPVLTENGYIARNSTDFFNILKHSFYLNATQINIDVTSYNGVATEDFKAVYQRAAAAVSAVTGVENFISSWKYVANKSTLTLTIEYRFTKTDFQIIKQHAEEALYKARHIVAGFIKPGMADYEKELYIHDYIVNNTKYDYENYIAGTVPDNSFTVYGCLVQGKAVCHGYSKAFKLLSDLSLLDCTVIEGESQASGKWEAHAWNIVRIAGKYYHADSAFNDPISEEGEDVIKYHYFNLADKDLNSLNRWDVSKYPVCNSSESNYYYKNGLVVSSMDEFETTVKDALNQRKAEIELRVLDYSKDRFSQFLDTIIKSADVSSFNHSVNDHVGVVSITNIKY